MLFYVMKLFVLKRLDQPMIPFIEHINAFQTNPIKKMQRKCSSRTIVFVYFTKYINQQTNHMCGKKGITGQDLVKFPCSNNTKITHKNISSWQ